MISEKASTKITITFDDERKLIANFLYIETCSVEKSHVCILDYQYDKENVTSAFSRMDRFEDAFIEAIDLIFQGLIDNKFDHYKVRGTKPYKYGELTQVAFAIQDIFADKDVIGDAEIKIY